MIFKLYRRRQSFPHSLVSLFIIVDEKSPSWVSEGRKSIAPKKAFMLISCRNQNWVIIHELANERFDYRKSRDFSANFSFRQVTVFDTTKAGTLKPIRPWWRGQNIFVTEKNEIRRWTCKTRQLHTWRPPANDVARKMMNCVFIGIFLNDND